MGVALKRKSRRMRGMIRKNLFCRAMSVVLTVALMTGTAPATMAMGSEALDLEVIGEVSQYTTNSDAMLSDTEMVDETLATSTDNPLTSELPDEVTTTSNSAIEADLIKPVEETVLDSVYARNSLSEYGDNGKFIAPIGMPDLDAIAITNREELEAIRDDLDENYYLLSDIDLSGEDWIPINGFSGIFNGNGHIINNLTITSLQEITFDSGFGETAVYAGLFGKVTDAHITNLGLENVNINLSNSTVENIGRICVGGIVGRRVQNSGDVYWRGRALLNNCFVSGNIIVQDITAENLYDPIYTGGLVGEIDRSIYTTTEVIYNCYNSASVSCDNGVVGGIIGNLESRGPEFEVTYEEGQQVYNRINFSHISHSYNDGDITGGTAGGIAGHVMACDIENVFNIGNIRSNTGSAGGIIGQMMYSIQTFLSEQRIDSWYIKNAYNTGKVYAAVTDINGDVVGGGAGGILSGFGGGAGNWDEDEIIPVTIESCYNSGTIGDSGIGGYSGGIISGFNHEGSIKNSVVLSKQIGNSSIDDGYAYSYIIGNRNIYMNNPWNPIYTNNLAIDSIAGNPFDDSDGRISHSQAQEQATYEVLGWDFDIIWKMPTDGGYPVFIWQNDNSGDDDNNNGGDDGGNGSDPSDTTDYLSSQLQLVTIEFDTAKGAKSTQVEWGADLFSRPSNVYNPKLALLSAVLSNAAYNGTLSPNGSYINEAYEALGFDGNGNDFELFSYPGILNTDWQELDGRYQDGDLAFAIGHRKIAGSDDILIMIVLKGTNSLVEWYGNLCDTWPTPFLGHSAHNYFESFASDVQSALYYYCTEHLTDQELNGRIRYLVTGHSLGAAGANLVAASLDYSTEQQSLPYAANVREDIYCYTFASPNSVSKSGDTNDFDDGHGSSNYDNLFNIVNPGDSPVTGFPLGWTNLGTVLAIPSIDKLSTNDEIENFKNTYVRLMDATSQEAETAEKQHNPEAYVAWIKSEPQLWNESYYGTYSDNIRGIAIACPVDVKLINSEGQTVADITNNQLTIHEQDDYLITVNDDEKYIYMPIDAEYKILLSGTDDGIMKYTTSEFDANTGEAGSEKVFDNVNLYNGKKMYSETSDTIDVPGTNLYVLDTQGTPIAEINQDGTETPIASPAIYTVTFMNGNTVYTTKTVTAPATTLDTLPANPTNGNYTFSGWYTEENGSGTRFYASTPVSSSMTVYAHWTGGGSNGGTSNGGSGGSGGGSSNTNASISKTTATFDKSNSTDIVVTLTKGRYTLTALKNASYTLKQSTDYTVSGNTMTIKKEYLAKLNTGDVTLTFDMSGGTDPKLTITVTDTSTSEQDTNTATPEPITPTLPVNPFTDVAGTDWFIDDVIYVYDNGLMGGTSESPMLFSPNVPITRGMTVTILYRHAGSPNVTAKENLFADVMDSAYYADAVKWASQNGIVSGYDGKFVPDASITRQDFAVILNNYMKFLEVNPVLTQQYVRFADENDVSDYAKNAMQTLHKLGVISGIGENVIDPKGYATRAQAAAMLHRFVEDALN
jgi:uncharacterized repeat protein (TIGR02543 family)